jgi:ATP synthase protein I
VTLTSTFGEPTKKDQSIAKNFTAMDDYYKLQNILLKYSLLLLFPIFLAVWFFISINIALNYLLGACVGIFYLRMLFRDVEKVGLVKSRVGSKGLLIVSGLIILACRCQQLQVIPVFLGFLTYKASIVVYMFQGLFTKEKF